MCRILTSLLSLLGCPVQQKLAHESGTETQCIERVDLEALPELHLNHADALAEAVVEPAQDMGLKQVERTILDILRR